MTRIYVINGCGDAVLPSSFPRYLREFFDEMERQRWRSAWRFGPVVGLAP